jgi:hypothetical protein
VNRRRFAIAGVLIAATAVFVLVALGTTREGRVMPAWGSGCAGVDASGSTDPATIACEQERLRLIADPPVVRSVDWLAAVAAGSTVTFVGLLATHVWFRRLRGEERT